MELSSETYGITIHEDRKKQNGTLWWSPKRSTEGKKNISGEWRNKEVMNTRPRNWVISCLSGKRCHALLSSEGNVKTDTERDSFRKKMNKMSEDNAEREDRRCHVTPAFRTLVPETQRCCRATMRTEGATNWKEDQWIQAARNGSFYKNWIYDQVDDDNTQQSTREKINNTGCHDNCSTLEKFNLHLTS